MSDHNLVGYDILVAPPPCIKVWPKRVEFDTQRSTDDVGSRLQRNAVEARANFALRRRRRLANP